MIPHHHHLQFACWLATVVCSLWPAGFALGLKNPKPREFAAFAFFALAWAVLVPFYNYMDPRPLYSYSILRGMLLMFSGSMLVWERLRKDDRDSRYFEVCREKVCLILLIGTIIPDSIVQQIIRECFNFADPSQLEHIYQSWIKSIMTGVSFYCLWKGLSDYPRYSNLKLRRRVSQIVALVLGAYTLCDIVYSVIETRNPPVGPYEAMPVFLAIAFLLLKILCTAMFVCIVGYGKAFLVDEPINRHVDRIAWCVQWCLRHVSKDRSAGVQSAPV